MSATPTTHKICSSCQVQSMLFIGYLDNIEKIIKKESFEYPENIVENRAFCSITNASFSIIFSNKLVKIS